MKIHTTINMNVSIVHRLISICEKYTLSKSQLITLLIAKFLTNKDMQPVHFKNVSYQKRRSKKSWKTIHVTLDTDIFEKCSNLRTFYKISVSLFIANAIEEYLDRIEEELSEAKNKKIIIDNYQHNYMCICNNTIKEKNFHTYWHIQD